MSGVIPPRTKPPIYVVTPYTGIDLLYRSKIWDFTSDPGYGTEWTQLTEFLVSSKHFNGDNSKQLLVEVSFDGGSSFITILDTATAIDLLDTTIPISSSTNQLQMRVKFFGSNLLDLAQEHLDRVDGRVALMQDDSTLTFAARIPLPTGVVGVPGRRLDFVDVDTQINVAHCISRDAGYWTVMLPYGNYKVCMGRKTVIENLIVGSSFQILSRRMSAIANQEERAWIAAQFGDLEWAQLCAFDTFEDNSKVDTTLIDAQPKIAYSRLYAANDRWMERLYVFIGATLGTYQPS